MSMTKILVVDDSLTDLTRIQQILSDVGHTVITATSGAEAIGKAQSERPDIIFLDVVMEGTNGFQACREIKKQADMNAVPVFLVTSKSQRVDHMYAKQVGASGLMPKPYESQQILDCLKAL